MTLPTGLRGSSLLELQIANQYSPEARRWTQFANQVMRGSSFGDAEVQRALNAGYTMTDINDYLRFSGITPSGNFAVGGFNTQTRVGGSGDGAGNYTTQTPFYRYIGNATAQPSTPAPAPASPAPAAPSTPAPAQPSIQQPTTTDTLPEPRFQQGGMGSEIDGGAAQGFRRRKSSARVAGLTTKGTSQFKISGQTGRSSGLNIGV